MISHLNFLLTPQRETTKTRPGSSVYEQDGSINPTNRHAQLGERLCQEIVESALHRHCLEPCYSGEGRKSSIAAPLLRRDLQESILKSRGACERPCPWTAKYTYLLGGEKCSPCSALSRWLNVQKLGTLVGRDERLTGPNLGEGSRVALLSGHDEHVAISKDGRSCPHRAC
jgi:hypothetical protein